MLSSMGRARETHKPVVAACSRELRLRHPSRSLGCGPGTSPKAEADECRAPATDARHGFGARSIRPPGSASHRSGAGSGRLGGAVADSTHHGGDPALPTVGTTGLRDRLHHGGGRTGVEARCDLPLLQTQGGQRDQRLGAEAVGSQADPDEVGVPGLGSDLPAHEVGGAGGAQAHVPGAVQDDGDDLQGTLPHARSLIPAGPAPARPEPDGGTAMKMTKVLTAHARGRMVARTIGDSCSLQGW